MSFSLQGLCGTLPSTEIQEAVFRYVLGSYVDMPAVCFAVAEERGDIEIKGIGKMNDPEENILKRLESSIVPGSSNSPMGVRQMHPLSKCIVSEKQSSAALVKVHDKSLSGKLFVIWELKSESPKSSIVSGYFYEGSGFSNWEYTVTLLETEWKVSSATMVSVACGG